MLICDHGGTYHLAEKDYTGPFQRPSQRDHQAVLCTACVVSTFGLFISKQLWIRILSLLKMTDKIIVDVCNLWMRYGYSSMPFDAVASYFILIWDPLHSGIYILNHGPSCTYVKLLGSVRGNFSSHTLVYSFCKGLYGYNLRIRYHPSLHLKSHHLSSITAHGVNIEIDINI